MLYIIKLSLMDTYQKYMNFLIKERVGIIGDGVCIIFFLPRPVFEG